jgi:small-conductance mechanosensitive channel
MKLFFSGRARPIPRVLFAFLLFATSLSSATPSAKARQESPAESKTPSHEPSNAVGSAQAAHGAAPGQPTAPKPITALHLEKLPQPLPPELTQGIDVGKRSKEILDHLNEVIRFYRMMASPIQKTGEPSDLIYEEQAQSVATEITQLAFQSARDEAALLARIQGASGFVAAPAEGQTQRLHGAQQQVAQKISDLQAREQAIEKQRATARPKARSALEQQESDLEGQLELAAAEQEALAKVAGVSGPQNNSGLQTEIDRLQNAVPEVVNTKVKPVASTMQSIGSLREAGVSSQAQVLFQIISTEHAIDQRIQELKRLHAQAEELRAPLVNILRATVREGQKLEDERAKAAQTAAGGSTPPAEVRKTYDQLTDVFKTISGVSVPVSQEVLLLEQAQGNLISWRAAVHAERESILHSLFLRLIIIAVALTLVLSLGEMWRRAAAKYVTDLRRRRQILVVRRMVIGFLSGIVILLGFVTQFSSLATFAGFISAGIAVGLQTILLSVAAYFFIVGRYGVKVGDRITVANVTGDVVEVGLVRFYMMELGGTGPELHPTGRVAVFANSVLFQTGTPLYKQLPGTNYAWHEISVKLKPGNDYQPVLDAIRNAVEEVYGQYKSRIERQHSDTEAWMETAIPMPQVETRLRLTDGLQFSVLFPVEMRRAAEIDQKVTQEVLEAMAKNPAVTQAVDGPPALRAVVK